MLSFNVDWNRGNFLTNLLKLSLELLMLSAVLINKNIFGEQKGS
jgi:hypothetical protein